MIAAETVHEAAQRVGLTGQVTIRNDPAYGRALFTMAPLLGRGFWEEVHRIDFGPADLCP
jgi:hypothetical protein